MLHLKRCKKAVTKLSVVFVHILSQSLKHASTLWEHFEQKNTQFCCILQFVANQTPSKGTVEKLAVVTTNQTTNKPDSTVVQRHKTETPRMP